MSSSQPQSIPPSTTSKPIPSGLVEPPPSLASLPSSSSSSQSQPPNPPPLFSEPLDTSEIEELTLSHRSSNPSPHDPLALLDEYSVGVQEQEQEQEEEEEQGEEDAQPMYEDEVGGELEGDYDLERAGGDYADDEGEDGSLDLDGDGEDKEGEGEEGEFDPEGDGEGEGEGEEMR